MITQADAPGIGPRIGMIDAAAYRIPTPEPESDGTLTWDATTMIIVRVGTRGGDVEGLGWTYADAPCVGLIKTKLAETIKGRPPDQRGRGGVVTPNPGPGHGLTLRSAAAASYAVNNDP